jgi:hypothetical protein
MTTRKTRAALPARETDYEVGYGKPPAHSRFQKGQSGNPQGRKKGSKNRIPDMKEERFKAIILDEAYREIDVREGDNRVTLPVIRAAVRTLANKGLKGETRSLKNFMELVGLVEQERNETWREYLKTMIDYKYDWDQELDRRKRLGITDLPEPELHPDDVIIDLRSGDARIAGPMTKEEVDLWERGREEVIDLAELIEFLEGRRREDPDNQAVIKAHRRLKKKYEKYTSVFGPRWIE